MGLSQLLTYRVLQGAYIFMANHKHECVKGSKG